MVLLHQFFSPLSLIEFCRNINPWVFVVDNASNLDNTFLTALHAINRGEGIPPYNVISLKCSCHTFNLVLKDVFDPPNPPPGSLGAVYATLQNIKVPLSPLASFPPLYFFFFSLSFASFSLFLLIYISQRIVAHFKQSPKSTTELKRRQVLLNRNVLAVGLKRWAETRWNSFFKVLERILQVKEALRACWAATVGQPRPGVRAEATTPPTDDEFHLVHLLVILLKQFIVVLF